jgi:hypothetical protein
LIPFNHKCLLRFIKIFIFTLLLLFWNKSTFAQNTNVRYAQTWADFMLHKTFKNGLIYIGEFGPRTLVNKSSGWYQLELAQSVQYNILWKIDAIGGLLTSYTIQTDTTDLYNSYELRPWLGARINFNPDSKLSVALLTRYEQRYLYYNNLNDIQKSGRARNRLEFTYSINRPNFYHDKLWYLTFDAEWFLPTNTKFEERFANAARLRLGIGYRRNYNWRYAIVFMEQFSRNTIDDEFKSSNFIIDLRVHFFIPAKDDDY